MPFPKKPSVEKKCSYCGKVVLVKIRRAKKFKFCSNKCKYEVKKQATSKRIIKPIPVKCSSIFCNKGKYLKPWQIKRRKNHFCSVGCFRYYISAQYKLDVAALQVKKVEEVKRNIWKL